MGNLFGGSSSPALPPLLAIAAPAARPGADKDEADLAKSISSRRRGGGRGRPGAGGLNSNSILKTLLGE